MTPTQQSIADAQVNCNHSYYGARWYINDNMDVIITCTKCGYEHGHNPCLWHKINSNIVEMKRQSLTTHANYQPTP